MGKGTFTKKWELIYIAIIRFTNEITSVTLFLDTLLLALIENIIYVCDFPQKI